MLENHKLYFALKVPDYDTFIVEPAPEVVVEPPVVVAPEAEVAGAAAMPEAEVAGAAAVPETEGAAANVGAAALPSGDENRTKPPLESSQRHEVE